MRKKSEAAELNQKLYRTLSLPDFCPSSFRDKISSSRLGPGSYNVALNTFSGPAHQFSQSSRFKESDPYAKYLHVSRKSANLNLHLPEVNLNIFRPSHKESKIKHAAQTLTQRLQDTKLTKRKIQQEKKLNLLKTLKDKSLKYKLRQKVKEFKNLSITIQVLMVIFTTSLSINLKGRKEVKKQRRIRKLILIFTLTCAALGKFKITLRKIRIFKSYRILKKYAVHMKSWLKQLKQNYIDSINDSIQQYMKKPLLHKIVNKVSVTVKNIQTAWRRSLDSKRVALKAKFRLFRYFERIVASESVNRIFIQLKKSFVLKELIRYRLKKLYEYNRNLKRHKKICEEIDKKNKKTIFRYGYSQKKPALLQQHPRKPHPNYFISKATYISLIIFLQSRRYSLS